jgi:hypothetical protein
MSLNVAGIKSEFLEKKFSASLFCIMNKRQPEFYNSFALKDDCSGRITTKSS